MKDKLRNDLRQYDLNNLLEYLNERYVDNPENIYELFPNEDHESICPHCYMKTKDWVCPQDGKVEDLLDAVSVPVLGVIWVFQEKQWIRYSDEFGNEDL